MIFAFFAKFDDSDGMGKPNKLRRKKNVRIWDGALGIVRALARLLHKLIAQVEKERNVTPTPAMINDDL